jgi:hypothetical protein
MHFLEQLLLHQALHTHTWWGLQEDQALFHGYPVMNLLMENHVKSDTTLQMFTTACVKHFTLSSFGEDEWCMMFVSTYLTFIGHRKTFWKHVMWNVINEYSLML